jgi:DNA-binding transcriptional MerR regulator
MSGIRTNAAAELLGVSPNTLRSWERRFDYPKPQRTSGGHRQYDLQELESLRRALLETHNISSAIQLARQRGEGPTSAARLVDAFDRFDEVAADRVMEESLAVRSIERTVEELLLPALEFAQDRRGREAELEIACRWATGWLHAARRLVPEPSRPDGVLLFDASTSVVDVESLHVQSLELALRRAGFRVLLLTMGIGQERVTRAMRALEPTAALVLCGGGATLDVVGRLVYAARQVGSDARVFDYRDAMPVSGGHAIRSLGAKPSDAVEHLRAVVEGRAPEPELPGFVEEMAPISESSQAATNR